jgi:hypothetical protein
MGVSPGGSSPPFGAHINRFENNTKNINKYLNFI